MGVSIWNFQPNDEFSLIAALTLSLTVQPPARSNIHQRKQGVSNNAFQRVSADGVKYHGNSMDSCEGGECNIKCDKRCFSLSREG